MRNKGFLCCISVTKQGLFVEIPLFLDRYAILEGSSHELLDATPPVLWASHHWFCGFVIVVRSGVFTSVSCQGSASRSHLASASLVKTLAASVGSPEISRGDLYCRLCKSLCVVWSEDGLSIARMHMLGQPCACEAQAPNRNHQFWACPVAQLSSG